MSDRPRCPFCLREYPTIEALTRHILYDNCRARSIQQPSTQQTRQKSAEKR